jgi:hypothetical protein
MDNMPAMGLTANSCRVFDYTATLFCLLSHVMVSQGSTDFMCGQYLFSSNDNLNFAGVNEGRLLAIGIFLFRQNENIVL